MTIITMARNRNYHVCCLVLVVMILAVAPTRTTCLQVQTQTVMASPVHALLLCRHGDSIWNGGCPGQVERFTGWTDVPLSKTGEMEAEQAARQLSTYFYDIDACFTSTLDRAKATTRACLDGLSKQQQPRKVIEDFRLSERHYGALQTFCKQDVEEGKHTHEIPGSDDADLVTAWRRSWFTQPPLLSHDDPRRLQELERWRGIIDPQDIPRGESLEMVAQQRVRPFLNEILTPTLDQMAREKRLQQRGVPTQATGLVVAHANSLRALLGVLCEVEDDPLALSVLERLKIPTGVPLVIHYQRLASGKYRACPLPEPDDCIIRYDSGLLVHPRQPPPDLGHPNLPVWPLDRCIQLLSRYGSDTDQALELELEDLEPAMVYRSL